MEGLAAMADRPGMDVVSEKGDHSGPIELMMDVINHLGDTKVARKAVVVVGAEDDQADVLIVGNIEQSIEAKEGAIF